MSYNNVQYPCFYLYKDKIGEWRWRFFASNQKIIADSGEGYQNKKDAIHGINLIKQHSENAPIYEN